MSKSTNIHKIHCDITDLISENEGLIADINALRELEMLLSENRECDPKNLSHLMESVLDKAYERVHAIKDLNEELIK